MFNLNWVMQVLFIQGRGYFWDSARLIRLMMYANISELATKNYVFVLSLSQIISSLIS